MADTIALQKIKGLKKECKELKEKYIFILKEHREALDRIHKKNLQIAELGDEIQKLRAELDATKKRTIQNESEVKK